MPQSSNLININTSVRHCLLEYLIKQLDTSQDLSRSAVFAREVRAAEKVENWNDKQLLLSDLKQSEKAEFPIFRNLQAKLDEETASILQRVRLKMENDLKDDIKVLQTRYMVLLLQMNYYLELKKRQVNSGNNVSSIDLPEMSKILTEMMLVDKDCQELEAIRQIMLKWINK